MTSLIHLDHVARMWVVLHRVEALNGVMWLLSVVGRGGMLFTAIAAVLAVVQRRPRIFVQVALAVLLAYVVTDLVLKPAVGRERPFVSTPGVPVIGGRPHDASFPSGHSANGFAAATSLTAVAPGGAVAWWSFAVAIAYSRVYLGVHYPGDVLAGALVGVLAAFVVIAACGGRRVRGETGSRERTWPGRSGRTVRPG